MAGLKCPDPGLTRDNANGIPNGPVEAKGSCTIYHAVYVKPVIWGPPDIRDAWSMLKH